MTADAERVSHTPGPWHVEECDDGYRAFNTQDFAIIAENRITPALVWGSSFSEGRANARLIAAAPDMLVALRAGVEEAWRQDLGNSTEFNQDIIHAMENAIAKAEGRDV